MLERPLIHGASVAPDMNIADASAVGPYYVGARLQAVQEHFVGFNIDRGSRYLHKRAGTTQAKHDFLANFVAERLYRLKLRAVGEDDHIASEQTGLLGRRALYNTGNHAVALHVETREDANAGIGDTAPGKARSSPRRLSAPAKISESW